MTQRWWLYVVRCQDDSLYCGITTNVNRRITEHNSGRGAKCITARKRPVVLVRSVPCLNRSEATMVEMRFKRLTKRWKEQLIAGWEATDRLISRQAEGGC